MRAPDEALVLGAAQERQVAERALPDELQARVRDAARVRHAQRELALAVLQVRGEARVRPVEDEEPAALGGPAGLGQRVGVRERAAAAGL